MPTCTRCGSFMDGSEGLCISCASSSAHGSGAASDVPCQRCGMYLPSHELRMWNSRLYCSYCIMDVQDEENLMRRHGAGHAPGSGKEGASEESGKISGACERCGRQADRLYFSGGRKLCAQCGSEGGDAPVGAPSMFAQLVVRAREILGTKSASVEPKILVRQPASKRIFSVKSRRMEDKKEGAGEKKEGKPLLKDSDFRFTAKKKDK